MASLVKFNKFLVGDDEKILKIESAVLYFVYNGRNAWHSVWVQRYYPNCFHTTLSSAKHYCESSRTNGTVFYIIETPALVLISNKNRRTFITQVNVVEPLLGYSADALVLKKDYRKEIPLIENAQDNYMVLGSLLSSVILSFDISSRFWRQRPELNNEVIILTENMSNAYKLKSSFGHTFASYKSVSSGKAYLLGWSSHSIVRKASTITAIVKDANDEPKILDFDNKSIK